MANNLDVVNDAGTLHPQTMSKGFNYSKWDKLELSDDEDSHPGAKFVEEQTLRYEAVVHRRPHAPSVRCPRALRWGSNGRRIKRESHKIKETERQEKIDKLQAEQQAGASGRPIPEGALILIRATCDPADDARYRELERQLGSLSSEETQSQEQLLAVQTAIDERSKQARRRCLQLCSPWQGAR